MADCMMFPEDWRDFLKDYSFTDSKQVYTNGSELIPLFRVIQLIERLLKEQEPREPHYTTLVYLVNETEVTVHHPECPRCIENGLALWDAEIERGQAYCKRCGQAVKWND